MPRYLPFTPMNLTFHVMTAVVNTNSCEIVTLAGHLDHARLRCAIAIALRRHPLANATIARHHGKLSWKIHESELPIDLRIAQTVIAERGAAWQSLLAGAWGETIPTDRARPLRFFLTEGPTESYFQMVAPHSCTDARAGALLANDIAVAYTALTENSAPETSVRDVPDRSVEHQLLQKTSRVARIVHLLRGTWGMVRDALAPHTGVATPGKANGIARLIIRDLGSDVLEGLMAYSRRHGVTMHATVCMALLRVRESHQVQSAAPSSDFRILDLCTLRPLASEEMDDVFDVYVTPYTLNLAPGWMEQEGLASIHAGLTKIKRGGILPDVIRLGAYTLLEPLTSMVPIVNWICRRVLKTNVTTTNPGVVAYPLERFGNVAIADFINFPQLIAPSELMFIYTTFRGRLRVLCLYDEGAFPNGVEETLLDPLVAELSQRALLASV
jgi:hypothetical protein